MTTPSLCRGSRKRQQFSEDRVVASHTPRRAPWFTRKKRNKGRNIRSYVCTKSQHQTSAAWFFTKVDQVWPPRRRCNERMYFWMVRLLTRIPSFRSSPRIRSAEPVLGGHLLDQAHRLLDLALGATIDERDLLCAAGAVDRAIAGRTRSPNLAGQNRLWCPRFDRAMDASGKVWRHMSGESLARCSHGIQEADGSIPFSSTK